MLYCGMVKYLCFTVPRLLPSVLTSVDFTSFNSTQLIIKLTDQLNHSNALLPVLVSLHHQTWLRVALGYHTFPQVAVGYALGAANAWGWWLLWVNHAMPALSLYPESKHVLMWATYGAGAAFALKNLLPVINDAVRAKM